MNTVLLIDCDSFFEDDPEYLGLSNRSSKTTQFFIAKALRAGKHAVSIIPYRSDIEALILALKQKKPDLVFNLVFHHDYDRRGEAYIPTILDMLKIRYTGPDSYGIFIANDKKVSKDILQQNGILVPYCVEFTRDKRIRYDNISYPVIVKPNYEHGSISIDNKNIAQNQDQLKIALKRLFDIGYQNLLVESFIIGKEVTVAVIGNGKNVEVFPPREMVFSNDNSMSGWSILTRDIKRSASFRKKHEIYSTKLAGNKALISNVKNIAKRAFSILKMRDYARIDMRITPDRKVYVIEVNCNPCLKPGKETIFDPFSGLSFNSVIRKIIEANTTNNRLS